jgi:protein-S-isoprenylcysteine O-methyltransferase Ste14
MQAAYWSWALLEIAVIIASNYPSSQYSHVVLDTLTSSPACCGRMRPTALFFLGWFLSVSSSLFRVTCFRLLGPMFTFELGIQKDHRLITTGPYAYVRHPSYLAVICGLNGIALAHLGPGSWVRECTSWMTISETLLGRIVGSIWLGVGMLTVLGLVKRMKTEDEMMKAHFGKEWEDWARTVRWRLIPGIY